MEKLFSPKIYIYKSLDLKILKMKSTKILPTLIEDEKWEDLIQFANDENTTQLFSSWINSKENESNIFKLIKNIPDKYIPSLIIKFPNEIIPLLVKNYKVSYSKIALELFNDKMRGNPDIISLFDEKLIKVILESLVPEKEIEQFNIYQYLKKIENNSFNYKNAAMKNLRLKQNFINIQNIIKSICRVFDKREEILNIIKETVEEMCIYMSNLDSLSVLPILSRVCDIIAHFIEEDSKNIEKEALKFNYPKVFPNTLYTIFIEGKTSECEFIEKLDKNVVFEEYFVPTVLDEIKKKKIAKKLCNKLRKI